MKQQVTAMVVVQMAGATMLSLQPTMDLTRVSARVAKEHPDWSQDRLECAERGYRQFWLTCKSSAEVHRPSQDVDEVWHAHVLHTREYARDCKAYFGYFLHHVPDEKTCSGKGCMNNGIHAADCQGGGDGCTACGSGCSGGGTIQANAVCTDGDEDEEGPII